MKRISQDILLGLIFAIVWVISLPAITILLIYFNIQIFAEALRATVTISAIGLAFLAIWQMHQIEKLKGEIPDKDKPE